MPTPRHRHLACLILTFLAGPCVGGCRPTPGPDRGGPGDEMILATDGGQHAAPHTAPGDLMPGLLPPKAYGHESWSGLHERVRRNLASSQLDLAKTAQLQDHHDQALEHALHALDVTLAVQGVPADLFFEGHGDQAKPLTVDARPLEQRVQGAVSDGWCGASLITLMQIEPSWAERVGAELVPDYDTHTAEPCGSIITYHRARAAELQGSPAQASALASQAASGMNALLVETVQVDGAELSLTDASSTWDWEPLAYPTAGASFPWGWRTAPKQIEALMGYASQAATLSGDAALQATVSARTQELSTVLEAWRATSPRSPRRVHSDALGWVPT